jgi:hypothetical protein
MWEGSPTIPTLEEFGLASQQDSGLSDARLIAGAYWYYKSIKDFDIQTELTLNPARKLLLLIAAGYGSFNAIDVLNHYDINQLFDGSVDVARTGHITKMLQLVEKTLPFHLAVGHILMVKTYLYLAKYYHDRKCYNRSNTNCYLALQHLASAKRLEPYSAKAIHNAYDGKTLQQAIQENIDPNFQSWDSTSEFIAKNLIHEADSEAYIKMYEKWGIAEAEKIITDYHLLLPEDAADASHLYSPN